MPTRLLYEKITVSVTLAEITAEEERFFYRLLVKCDDHGRFHAHPAILLGHLFSLQSSEITAEDVRRWRDRLAEVGLIRTYVAEGREYLSVTTWKVYQRQRASSSKFPEPPPLSAARGHPHAGTGPPGAAQTPLPEGEARSRGHPHADADNCGSRDVFDPVPGDDTRGTIPGGRRPKAGARAAEPRIAPPSSAAAPPVESSEVDSSEKTPPPEHLEPSEDDYALGAACGLDRGQVRLAAQAMLDRYRARGEGRSDWGSTFRGWLRNAPKYDQQRAPPSGLNGHTTAPSIASTAPVQYLYDDSSGSNDAT